MPNLQVPWRVRRFMHNAMRFIVLLVFIVGLPACASNSEDRVIGTWEPVDNADGAQMRYTFFADGRALLVARPDMGQPQTFDARFSISGDSLLSLSDSEGTERFGFSLRDDTLRITSQATGVEAAFIRVQGDS